MPSIELVSKHMAEGLPSAIMDTLKQDEDTFTYVVESLAEATDKDDIADILSPYVEDDNEKEAASVLLAKCFGLQKDATPSAVASANAAGVIPQESPAVLKVSPAEELRRAEEEAALLDAKATRPKTAPTNTAEVVGKQKKARGQKSQKKTAKTNEVDLRAVAQHSRFWIETIDHCSKDIDLKDVSITIDGHELLASAPIKLMSGWKYGLIGRNGVGKSTLLQCMANGTLVGFPPHIRVVYVQQEIVGDESTPLQCVLETDQRMMTLQRRAGELRRAIDAGTASDRIAVVAKLKAELAEENRAEKQAVADKRTGLRGHIARQEALEAEGKLAEADAAAEEAKRVNVQDDDGQAEAMLLDIEKDLFEMDAEGAVARAHEILVGLEFEDVNCPTRILSGGWRMRVALAKALFMNPDLLLLDEPTNHLSFEAIIWLKQYLIDYEKTLVVVSHDRYFLNEVVDHIILFRKGTLAYYDGNYDAYEEATEEYQKKQANLFESVERRRKAIEESIQKALTMARKSGDDKKLSMVASRRKKLQRLGQERTDDGRRWKRSTMGLRKEVVIDTPDPPVKFNIPNGEPLGYYGPVLQLQDVSLRYTENGKDIIKKVDFDVDTTSRIALLGRNGAGKSSLISLLAGENIPTDGKVWRHHNLKIGYFNQHHVDNLDLSMTPLQHMFHKYPGSEKNDVWAHLGGFGLGSRQVNQRMETLSGGEKSRVIFATLTWSRPHILLLDEVSNHLDLDTIHALCVALNDFNGGVVLVSHDQFLLSRLGEDFFVVHKGKVRPLENGLNEYVETLEQYT